MKFQISVMIFNTSGALPLGSLGFGEGWGILCTYMYSWITWILNSWRIFAVFFEIFRKLIAFAVELIEGISTLFTRKD